MAPCINCSTDEIWYLCEIPHCRWKAWMGFTAAFRAAKPENHIYCSHSKQAATNTQTLILMRSWMPCLLPKWLLEYFVGFALLGQKLTSRVVHMENTFRNVGRGKSWWRHQNNSASHYCWSHNFQNGHVPWGNSPTLLHRTVLSFVLLVLWSMKSYFVSTRFQPFGLQIHLVLFKLHPLDP